MTFRAPPAGERFFFGPKDFDVLRRSIRELVRAIDFGMFAWLVVPLLRALKWVNGYVGNYGWSIIVLTVLINLAMFPLRHKSVVSMRKMQEVQPEVKAIQDRYAKLKMSDPARQKMNVGADEAVPRARRQSGERLRADAADAAGAVRVLRDALGRDRAARRAVRRAGSRTCRSHDPWFITPVLMGVTQFVQQKMTPSTADPMQQKIMLFMPIMFMTHVPLGAERPGALLDREQRLGDRPADGHQPADRTGAVPASSGRRPSVA